MYFIVYFEVFLHLETGFVVHCHHCCPMRISGSAIFRAKPWKAGLGTLVFSNSSRTGKSPSFNR